MCPLSSHHIIRAVSNSISHWLPANSLTPRFQFVVDHDNWVVNDSAPKEADHEGNVNNFLTPDEIIPEAPAAAIMNTVTPESTTAALAKDVPLEKDTEPAPTPSDVPGGFPITPAAELDKPIGISPLPAAEGGVNPITLKPGAKVPHSIAGSNVNEHVKLDKESYEKSDALPGVDTELPPITKNMIPESSLPIAAPSALISSVTPTSTTAALAAEVPLEPKVPEVVKESQEAAKVDPEASADPEEVKEKAAVETELLAKVPEVPAAAEGVSGFGTTKTEGTGGIVAAAAAVATTVVAAAVAAKDTVVDKLPESVKESLPAAVTSTSAAPAPKAEEVSPEVPAEVKESIVESGKSPEAAANTEAVEDKKAVEAELLKEVKPVPAEGESSTAKAAEAAPPAPEATNGAETAAAAAVAKETPANNGTTATPTTAEKKKRNRLSTIFSKIKHKLSDKEK